VRITKLIIPIIVFIFGRLNLWTKIARQIRTLRIARELQSIRVFLSNRYELIEKRIVNEINKSSLLLSLRKSVIFWIL
jgi:hypothetical protein